MYTRLSDPAGGRLDAILRDADGAHIPADPLNADWQAYRAWLAEGNAPAEAAQPEGRDMRARDGRQGVA